MLFARVIWVGLHDLLEELDLVDRSLRIVSCGPYNLQRNMSPRLGVP